MRVRFDFGLLGRGLDKKPMTVLVNDKPVGKVDHTIDTLDVDENEGLLSFQKSLARTGHVEIEKLADGDRLVVRPRWVTAVVTLLVVLFISDATWGDDAGLRHVIATVLLVSLAIFVLLMMPGGFFKTKVERPDEASA